VAPKPAPRPVIKPVEATVLSAREAVQPRKAAIEKVDHLFEDYFRLAPVPMIVLNRDGHVERMNRAAEEATEFAAAELRSQPYWEVFLEEVSAPEARQDLESVLALREGAGVRQTWKTRMGRQLHLDWQRTVLRDDFGQGASILAVGLPAAPDTAAALDVVALADQLTAVNGYSELLLMSVPQEDPIRADLESIHRAGLAASGQIRREAA
jgi:PAS domain S-box-containing protein